MSFNSIFNQVSEEMHKSIKKEEEKALKGLSLQDQIKKKQELKKGRRDRYWDILGLSIGKYITKSITNGIGRLDTEAGRLSILKNNKREIEENRSQSKFIPSNEGGPTDEKIYASGIALAKKLGWKEREYFEQSKDPIITPYISPDDIETNLQDSINEKLHSDLKDLNLSEKEINTLEPQEAWNLIQQKTIEQDIQDPKEKVYTIDMLDKDFSVLQNLWDKAYDDMDNVTDSKRTNELLSLTAQTLDDTTSLENYLNQEFGNITPEEKFFIEVSIQLKKFRKASKELLAKKNEDTTEPISDFDFDKFIDTNTVSENILSEISQAITQQKILSERQIAIYAYKSVDIEKIIRNYNSI